MRVYELGVTEAIWVLWGPKEAGAVSGGSWMGIGPDWDLIVLPKVRTDTSYPIHPLSQA